VGSSVCEGGGVPWRAHSTRDTQAVWQSALGSRLLYGTPSNAAWNSRAAPDVRNLYRTCVRLQFRNYSFVLLPLSH
jgi:hypothetical protein